jgi:hypothetical protein
MKKKKGVCKLDVEKNTGAKGAFREEGSTCLAVDFRK